MPEPITTPSSSTVMVLAHSRLVGEAVAVALEARGLGVVQLAFPTTRAAHLALRRRVAESSATTGLVVADLDDLRQWRDVLHIVDDGLLPWLVVTGSADQVRWGALLDLGCRGIVPMTGGLDALARALHAIRRHALGMPAAARDRALRSWRILPADQRDLVRRVAALTDRDWTLLEGLQAGLSLHDIGVRDGTSDGTVRSQMRTIRQKLNVSSQLAAVAAYQQTLQPSRDGR